MYTSEQHLTDEFGELEMIQLTDRGEPPSGAIDTQVVARAIEKADAEIDGYLAGRYALPLASVPRLLVGVACDLVRFYLYKDVAPDLVVSRYKNAVRLLEAIAAGKVNLGLDAANQAPTGANVVQFPASGKVFGRDSDRAEAPVDDL